MRKGEVPRTASSINEKERKDADEAINLPNGKSNAPRKKTDHHLPSRNRKTQKLKASRLITR